jgi:hypothetical protein
MKLGIYVCFCVALCGYSEAADETCPEVPTVPTEVSVRSGSFSKDEDALLERAVDKYGQMWGEVGRCVGRRAKTCRIRWNTLHGSRSLPWTASEDVTLCESVGELGKRWALVATRLKGRTENAAKSRYYFLPRKARDFYMGITTPVMHSCMPSRALSIMSFERVSSAPSGRPASESSDSATDSSFVESCVDTDD